jgi:hypothetical protein
MSDTPPPPPRATWTAERQFRFLRCFAATGSPSLAAASAGMSRESAYRLLKREPDGLFALMWRDLAMRAVTRVAGHSGERRL